MQQPPNQEYPQQQWQQQNTSWGSTPLWHQYKSLQPQYPQQMPSPQQWNPQQPPIQRPKQKRVVLWVSVGIIGTVLAILVVVSSVLIGYSLFFSPSHSLETIFTSTQYPTLHTEYSGTIFDPTVTYNGSPITTPMALIITSNDNQGHISGRVGMLTAPNGGDPFIGTLGVDSSITFTATPLLIGVFTVFTGMINSDGSIIGATSNIYQPETWKLFPVKGH